MSDTPTLGPTGIMMQGVEIPGVDIPVNSPAVTQAALETETDPSLKAAAAIDLVRWKSSPPPVIDEHVLVEQSSEYEGVLNAMTLLDDEIAREGPLMDEIDSNFDPSMPLYKTKHHELGVGRFGKVPGLFAKLEGAISGLTGKFQQAATVDAEHVAIFDHFTAGLAAWSPEYTLEIAESLAVTGNPAWASVRPILERYALKTPGPWRGLGRQLATLLDAYPAPQNGRRAARRARELATAARQSYRRKLIEFVRTGK